MDLCFYSIGKYLEMELLGHSLGIYLTLQEIANLFPKIIVHFIFIYPQAKYESSG